MGRSRNKIISAPQHRLQLIHFYPLHFQGNGFYYLHTIVEGSVWKLNRSELQVNQQGTLCPDSLGIASLCRIRLESHRFARIRLESYRYHFSGSAWNRIVLPGSVWNRITFPDLFEIASMSRFRSHHFVGDYHYLENKKVLSLTIKKIITSFLEFQRHFLKKPDHCVSVSEFVSK